MIAALGAVGEAGIDEDRGDASGFGHGDEVWPDFSLDEDELGGGDEAQHATDDGAEVDRIEEGDDPIGVLFLGGLGQGLAGGRGGGEDNRERWIGGEEFLDQLPGDSDLTDADSMNPQSSPRFRKIGKFLEALLGQATEALAEVGPLSAASPHLDDGSGKQDQETGNQKQVIDQQTESKR